MNVDSDGTDGHVEGRLSGLRDIGLYWQGWLPESTPRAAVILVHGAFEHGGRYSHVAKCLADAGIASYVVDFRGHGRSGGRPAQIGRMSYLVDDVDRLSALVAERHPDIPLFMVAHSLGAVVALEYVIGKGHALAGLVLSGTVIDVSAISPLQIKLAKALSSVAPNFPLVKFDPEGVSRDPDVVRDYCTDPLNFHGKVPVRLVSELFSSADRIAPRLNTLTVPLLVLHGGSDPAAAPDGARMIFRSATSKDKSIMVYEGLRHEIFNEPEKDAVLADVLAWITERI